MKKFLSALPVVLLVAAGCNSLTTQTTTQVIPSQQQEVAQNSTPQADPTANWKTYTNSTYNFSFKYPADLNIETSSGSSNFEKKFFTVDLETSKYANALKNGETLETFPFLRVGAHIPKQAIQDNVCVSGTNQTGVTIISSISVKTCESMAMGQFPHLDTSFKNGNSSYIYFIQSDSYSNNSANNADSYSTEDKTTINTIISTFKFTK